MKRVLWSAIVLMMLAVGVAACGSSVAGEPAGSTVASTASTAATLPPTTASTTPPTTVAEVVVFNDPVLEERIRAALNKPQGDITVAEAEAVKELDLENKDNKPDWTISDISALASFKNLKNLTISLNNIKDLSPLAGMNLEVFYSMNGNQDITDFSPLAGSTAMLDLTILSNENINDSNIGFIDGMTNIEHAVDTGRSPAFRHQRCFKFSQTLETDSCQLQCKRYQSRCGINESERGLCWKAIR